ncbi:antibiotic biosynthesis monooxygenase, partial [Rhodococcus erythropolis]|nr:antibiotic biosynthesis monooxygenase [Rhodococcus erythropolis]
MLLRSVTDSTQWKSVLRFRTEQQLAEWMASPERAAALPKLRAELAEDFTETTRSTPFGTILRTENGQTRATPNWKTAMIILL